MQISFKKFYACKVFISLKYDFGQVCSMPQQIQNKLGRYLSYHSNKKAGLSFGAEKKDHCS
jgi:hypothetical protein